MRMTTCHPPLRSNTIQTCLYMSNRRADIFEKLKRTGTWSLRLAAQSGYLTGRLYAEEK
jgi:hypothetical protein